MEAAQNVRTREGLSSATMQCLSAGQRSSSASGLIRFIVCISATKIAPNSDLIHFSAPGQIQSKLTTVWSPIQQDELRSALK